MPEEHIANQAGRRRRVKRLKRLIVLTLTALILTPTVLCVLLSVRISSLEGSVALLSEELDGLLRLTRQLQDQQAAADALARESASAAGRQAQARHQESVTAGILEDKEETGRDEYGSGAVSGGNARLPGSDEEAGHKVYLTFDDGPSVYTEEILDILDRYEVKAAFFVLGKEDEKSRERLKEIVSRGHTLGMHSYSHRYAEIYRSVEDFAEDFNRLRDFLYETTGVLSGCYRFPGGSSNTVSTVDMHEFIDFLDENGVRFYDWNASSGDGGAKLLDVGTLTDNSLLGLENRETTIILFHDSGDKRTTVEALPMVIERILDMEDTVILPISEDTEPIQHIHKNANIGMEE